MGWLLLSVCFAVPQVAYAVPAAPGVHTVEQPNGTFIDLIQRGDEWHHWWETPGGQPMAINRQTGYWVPTVRPVPSPLIMQRRASAYRRVVPPTGTGYVPVMLADFTDTTPTYTPSNFQSALFGSGTGSMADFYSEVSYGAFTVSSGPGGVDPWRVASNTHNHYGQNDFLGFDQYAPDLVREAAVAADAAGFNFAPYDQDSDSNVDVLFVIHQGEGEEASANPNDIWSHRWSLSAAQFFGYGSGPYVTNDGVTVDDYVIVPEVLWGQMQTVGVSCHEYAHALGLPDLYDTDYSSAGLGDWALMAGGSWNGTTRAGDSPAHLVAWCKAGLGWVNPTVVESILSGASVPQTETNSAAYKLYATNPTGQEYFLVENRQLVGFDSALPGSGLLVYHIDDAVTTQNDNEWYPGYTMFGHYLVALEQADGLFSLEQSYFSSGDAGDPYPGSANNRTFGLVSNPNSQPYAGTASGSNISNISNSASTMTADLDPGSIVLTAVIDEVSPNPQGVGQPVHFAGHGQDSIAGHTIVSYEWQSDADGTIGTAATFDKSDLSQGSHNISFRVKCSGGTWSNWVTWSGNPLQILVNYSISGTVTNAGAPLAGVQVTADGDSVTTAGDGTYTIEWLSAATYTVTPALAEYTFSPSDTQVTLSAGTPQVTGIDFVGTQNTYSISGTVDDEEDAAIEGVTVTINGQSTTTLSDGTYTISGFLAGTYTVTPSLTEHRFTPSSSSATVNESVGNATGVDFVGTNKIHSISGTVTNAGDPLAGVDVTADSKSATTAANGTYTIDRLVAGTYTVTPTMPEYDFAPLSTGVSVSDAVGEATNVDFVGTEKTYTISGTVTNEQDDPMEGVELSASGKSTTTGPDGTYTLGEFVAGTYSVKPSFSEYDFTPSETNVTVNENDGPATDVDFVGSPKQYTISGTILDWEGNAMSGVEVSANGHSATTDASGEYSISGPVAGTYTVIPEQAGRGFVPDSQEVTVNEDVGDASDIDFTGYPAYTTQLSAGLSLVGVPCQPVTDDLSEVFATDEVVRWAPDREPPGYLGLGDSGVGPLLALAAGKGYFVRHTTPQEISVLGLPVPTDVTFQLPLGTNSGWNLVANPFPQTLPFSKLMIEASHILPYGFVYDTATGSYQVVTDKVGVNITRNSLEPWEGMWIRALQSPATLFIQPPGPAAAEAESAVRAADLGPRGWAIPVTARIGDRADLSSVCGVGDNQAAYQIDNPPAVSGAVDLYFVTEEGRHLAHDIRPASGGQTTWDFVVCTDIPDSEVQVRLSDLSAVPHDLTVLLTDLDAQRTVYARTVPLYTFHSSAEGVTVRHFRLQVRPKSDAGLMISSAAVHPAPAGLTIAYTVSQPCAVTIEITNISGRLINRVCSAQPVAAGVNTTTWSLRSHEGTQVPSGRYLICLQAVAANGQSVTRIVSTQIVR